jgi:putative ABC transport system permease protein
VTRVALRSLWGRKLRFFLTASAIVLGVSMVSGTYVLTDTIKAGFNTIFQQSYSKTDVVVTGKSAIGGDSSGNQPSFSQTLLAKVRALPGVEAADGGVAGQAQIIGRSGKVISSGGAPNLGFSVNSRSDQRFNPLNLVAGTWPLGQQVAIDKFTADKHGFRVGDSVGIVTRGPAERFRISGIAKFGSVSSIGGATFAVFDTPVAQRLFQKVGKLDEIRVAAKPGVSDQEVVNQIERILPPATQVRTGAQQAAKQSSDTSNGLSFIQYFLLAFGFIALFVGAFVIANTLSITVAQQTREFATLRTIGASRRQILASVFLESLVLGVTASLTGLFLGLALAKGLNALFVAFGIDLPKSGLVFATRTIVVSLVLGVLVTVLASLRPAFRATRVPPIAAVREGATLPPGRFHRLGRPASIITVAGAIALLVYGVTAHGIATGLRLGTLGVGALLLFIGVALVAPALVRPIVAVVGWPATKVGGAAGTLAKENSLRNPQRTASTAAALMIGLALVTFVAVLGAGLRASFEDAVNKLSNADYALTSTNGFTPLTVSATDALRGTAGATAIVGVRGGQGGGNISQAKAFGKNGSTVTLTGVDTGVSKVMNLKWVSRDPSAPDNLGATGSFVTKSFAKKHHLKLGSQLPLLTPQGQTIPAVVKGIFDPPPGGSPFGPVTIAAATFDRYYQDPENVFSFIRIEGGVNPGNTAALEGRLGGFPNAKLQTIGQFKKNQEQGLNILLNLLYVLLALSVIVSIFGIVNTLVLTVFERTRELGMLRAVGTTRRQVRRMIRHESVITSLIGAVLAIPIGIALAALVSSAISFVTLAIPWGTLLALLIAAVVVGILAAILPARRAARIDILQALSYE